MSYNDSIFFKHFNTDLELISFLNEPSVSSRILESFILGFSTLEHCVISANFLVWKFSHKVFTPGN